MAFDSFAPAAVVAATAVKTVQIVLTITDGSPKVYAARYSFDRLAADGSIVNVREGNLVPHLTAPQLTQLKVFLDSMLTKAQGSI